MQSIPKFCFTPTGGEDLLCSKCMEKGHWRAKDLGAENLCPGHTWAHQQDFPEHPPGRSLWRCLHTHRSKQEKETFPWHGRTGGGGKKKSKPETS